jgi:hypothetical protein
MHMNRRVAIFLRTNELCRCFTSLGYAVDEIEIDGTCINAGLTSVNNQPRHIGVFIALLSLMCFIGAHVSAAEQIEDSIPTLDVKCFRIPLPTQDAVIDAIYPHFKGGLISGSKSPVDNREQFVAAMSSEHTVISAPAGDWNGDDLLRHKEIRLFETTASTSMTADSPFEVEEPCSVPYLSPLPNGRYELRTSQESSRFTVFLGDVDEKKAFIHFKSVVPTGREPLPGVDLPVGRPTTAPFFSIHEVSATGPRKTNAFLVCVRGDAGASHCMLVFTTFGRLLGKSRPQKTFVWETTKTFYTTNSRIIRIPVESIPQSISLLRIDSSISPIRGRAEFIPSVPDTFFEIENAELVCAPRLTMYISPLNQQSEPVQVLSKYPSLGVAGPHATDAGTFSSRMTQILDFYKSVSPLIAEFMTAKNLGSKPALVADLVTLPPIDAAEPTGSEMWRMNAFHVFGITEGIQIAQIENDPNSISLDIAFRHATSHLAVLAQDKRGRPTRMTQFPYAREFRFQLPVKFDQWFAFSYYNDVTGDRYVVAVTISPPRESIEAEKSK